MGYGGASESSRKTAEKLVEVIGKADVKGLWLVATGYTVSGFHISLGRKLAIGGSDIRMVIDVENLSEFSKTPDYSNRRAAIYGNWGYPGMRDLAVALRNTLVDDGFSPNRIESDDNVSAIFERIGGKRWMDSDGYPLDRDAMFSDSE